jgi:hypothetical protein
MERPCQRLDGEPVQGPLIVVRYEDLKRDSKELRRLCEFLNQARRSVAATRRGRRPPAGCRTRNPRKAGRVPPPKDKKFVRRGEAGSYRDEMSQEVLTVSVEASGTTKHGYLVESDSTWPGSAGKTSPGIILEEAVCCLNNGHSREALEASIAALLGINNRKFHGGCRLARLGCCTEAVDQLNRLVAFKPPTPKPDNSWPNSVALRKSQLLTRRRLLAEPHQA